MKSGEKEEVIYQDYMLIKQRRFFFSDLSFMKRYFLI